MPHRIELTGDEARRLLDRCTDDVSVGHPVQSHRPVPVEATDHARTTERSNVDVEVVVGHEAEIASGRIREQPEVRGHDRPVGQHSARCGRGTRELDPLSIGALDAPYPRTSRAATRQPRSAKCETWCRHEWGSSGQPCTHTIVGPSPTISTRSRMSPLSTMTSSIWPFWCTQPP